MRYSNIFLKYFLGIFLPLLVICNTPLANSLILHEFSTVEQQKRYTDLLQELRCLVCQNQSLSDSNAEWAQDMRAIIAGMVENGITDDAILKFITDRYGNFVRYRPPLNQMTLILWGLPFLLVLIVLGCVPAIMRQNQSVKLSEVERKKAAQVLAEK